MNLTQHTLTTLVHRNPDLLAEMYAYSIAAAHEYLPHFTMMHYMVSNTQMRDEEGWKWVDDLGDDVSELHLMMPHLKHHYFSLYFL